MSISSPRVGKEPTISMPAYPSFEAYSQSLYNEFQHPTTSNRQERIYKITKHVLDFFTLPVPSGLIVGSSSVFKAKVLKYSLISTGVGLFLWHTKKCYDYASVENYQRMTD